MRQFINFDGPFMNFLNKAADLVIINILYIVCCIPVFTIGAATTAMYYSVYKVIEDRGSSVVKGFFHSFCQNFKQGTIIWLVMMFFYGVVGVDFYFLYRPDAESNSIMVALLVISAFVLLCVMEYVFPLLARFDNSIKNTLVNAVLLCIGNLPQTIAIFIFNVLPFVIVYTKFKSVWYVVVLGFAVSAYANSVLLLKIFEKFMPQEEVAEIDKIGEEKI